MDMDKEQGGFTEGTGAVVRVFILWTIIVFRWLVLAEATFAVFMDLASFFDTISPLLVAVYTRRKGIPVLVSKYIAKMYEYSKIIVRTAAGTANSIVRRGIKQGGRFSPTAAELALMEINEGLRNTHKCRSLVRGSHGHGIRRRNAAQ